MIKIFASKQFKKENERKISLNKKRKLNEKLNWPIIFIKFRTELRLEISELMYESVKLNSEKSELKKN